MQKQCDNVILELTVRNHPGVMTHVCGLFARRAFNVEGILCLPIQGSEHSRIWLLQMEDVAFVSSRMSGIYVTDREGKEGFTELTLRTLESRTPLLRCHRQYLVNMAHLKEIRLEENGQAELLMRAGQTVPVSRRYLKSLKEAIGL